MASFLQNNLNQALGIMAGGGAIKKQLGTSQSQLQTSQATLEAINKSIDANNQAAEFEQQLNQANDWLIQAGADEDKLANAYGSKDIKFADIALNNVNQRANATVNRLQRIGRVPKARPLGKGGIR